VHKLAESSRSTERVGEIDDPGATYQALSLTVGSRLRAERQRNHLTLSELAQRSGLSTGMLSKIENAQLSPSLRTLARLGTALAVPVTTFFRGLDEEHDASFVKAGQGIQLVLPHTQGGHQYELLTVPFQQRRRMEGWLIALPDASEALPLYQHDGSELVYVLEGAMVWRYGGGAFDMNVGDCLLIDASVPHGPEQLRDTPVRFLAVSIEDYAHEQ
jgi:transcriptional regulator with XRE-family HTH domain